MLDDRRPDRVAVVGPSGAGKSTLAAALSERTGLPHLELDAVHHLAGWQPRPTSELRAHVGAAVAAERWVVDGNYPTVRDLVWPRATTLVWLDLPRALVTWRVARRSAVRVTTGTELWNGNREIWHEAFRLWDPDLSPIAHTWRRQPLLRRELRALVRAPEHAHLEVVRLTSSAAADRWLTHL